MEYLLDFNSKVNSLIDYLQSNNIKAMILGISGGIDSTVCAAICHEVSKRTEIPLIGRSLPTMHNKEGETTTADLVGKAFCDDYKEINIQQLYNTVRIGINDAEIPTKSYNLIANGNIQARLRMIYLYNLASIHKGIVIDTDNLTEHYLGYWTLHGDVGDYKPIGDLWKTEVFELAKQLQNLYNYYAYTYFYAGTPEITESEQDNLHKAKAICESLKLKPTAGLGITDSDLDELGAESYEQVDAILQEILRLKERGAHKNVILETFRDHSTINPDIINNIVTRHFNSEFKRKHLPIKT